MASRSAARLLLQRLRLATARVSTSSQLQGWQATRLGPSAFLPCGLRPLTSLPSASAPNRAMVTERDIMPMAEYEKVRKDLIKNHRTPLKKLRRVALGPSASVLFTNYDLIWFQIHEMLRIEKGGEEQIKDELSAYKDLIPKGGEICACLMYEVDNETVRRKFLEAMVGSENKLSMLVGGKEFKASPIHDDIDRTHPDGRTSAVHFLRWKLSSEEASQVGSGGEVLLKMGHPHYPHMTALSAQLVRAMSSDLSVK